MDAKKPLPADDPVFEPSGREPELPGFEADDAPMLGGRRRLWPSLAAYLLAEQHRAHRAGDMARVWAIRLMRARIQRQVVRERDDALLEGRAPHPLTDEEAYAEIVAERDEVLEALEQANVWMRFLNAAQHRQTLTVIEEVLVYWRARLDFRG